jgi:coenzyme F420-reducing hydrogenase beta subunit
METMTQNKELNITIDGQQVKVKEGTTVLTLAREMGIDIPTLCYHKELSPYGSCRLCSVEVTNKWGKKRIVTSCNYPVEEGIVVETKNDRVIKVRKGILSLLMARCPKSVKLKNLSQAYGLSEHGLWESNPDEDCILCGLCVRVCKELVGVSAINFARRGVEREVTSPYHRFSDDCMGCGSCALVCPTGSKRIRNYTYATIAPLKGTRDDIFGVHSDIYSAMTPQGQDRLVKDLLVSGFKNGLFDTAVFAQRKDGYNAEAVIADNIEAILNAKPAPYVRVKTMSTLLNAIDSGKRKIAFVGLPCQVRAVRKMQQTQQQEMPDLDITSIGLFCRQSYNPSKLKEEINQLTGVDIDQEKDHKLIDDNIDNLSNAIDDGCNYCNDFPAMFADLAVGAAGSAEGCSTVIVRTEKGQTLLDKITLTKTTLDKDAIAKLSESKRNRAKKHVEPILKEIQVQRAKKVQ